LDNVILLTKRDYLRNVLSEAGGEKRKYLNQVGKKLWGRCLYLSRPFSLKGWGYVILILR
jgi:hypothetical protein